ncbi:MAG: XTP/dITP diphosphatase [Chloroflexi bacterium]|nr:XTP/dITP diphosphatase [Chloroflexota bacterium]
MPKPRLLIATHNQGKIREYKHLLAGIPFRLVGLDEVGIFHDVEETGDTFSENAILKAQAYSRESGLLTLADDSGLEVDALLGEPGVRSSRYAGPGAGDPERIAFLLQKLAQAESPVRTARFRCVIAIAQPAGETVTAEGTCEGVIADTPRGSGGFGYDPIFYLPDQGCTMAELSSEAKNQISHRARAVHRARDLLLAADRAGETP